jgi:hypothetical protein
LFNCEHTPPLSAEEGSTSAAKDDTAMAVTLRGFSLDVLAQLSLSGSDPHDETVKAAVRRYLDDRALHPPGWQCLRLPEEDPAEEGIPVDLGEAMLGEVVAEAAAQGVALDALVSHAVMYAAAASRSVTQPPQSGTRRRSTRLARSDRRSRT